MKLQNELDLTELRTAWDQQRVRMREILARIELRGLTRPARDPEERAWLAEHGDIGLVEDEAGGILARAYYERRYTRQDSGGGR